MRTKLLTFVLILSTILATLCLVSCGFVEVEAVTVHFYIDGTHYRDMTVSAYSAGGLDVGEKSGYYFDGWYADEQFTEKVSPASAQEDVSVYGRWLKDTPKAKTYTVTFVADQKVLSTIEAATVSDIVYPTPPVVEGKVFSEWRGKPSVLTEDCTLTAVYRNLYKVEFVDESGRLLARQQVAEGSFASPPVPPQKESTAQYSYTFAGWAPSSGDYNAVDCDMVVRPTYTSTVNRYTYTLHKNNGEADEVRQVNYGSRVTFAVPTKQPTVDTVYTFEGWDEDEDGTADTAGNAITKNLYADYEAWALYSESPRSYTVTFSIDGEETQVEAVYGSTASYALGTPERERTAQYTYAFAGWDVDGDEVVDGTSFVVESDVVAVAVFDATLNWYTYAFFDADGTPWGESCYAPYGTVIELPDTHPTKEEDEYRTYAFSAWSGYTEDMILEADVSFTAVFSGSVRLYSIKFQINNKVVAEYKLPYETVIDYDEYVKPYPFPIAEEPCAYGWLGWSENYKVVKDKVFVLVELDETPTATVTWVIDEDRQILAYYCSGGLLALPAEPTREGYVFAGWDGYVAGTKVTEDITITAQWTAV